MSAVLHSQPCNVSNMMQYLGIVEQSAYTMLRRFQNGHGGGMSTLQSLIGHTAQDEHNRRRVDAPKISRSRSGNVRIARQALSIDAPNMDEILSDDESNYSRPVPIAEVQRKTRRDGVHR